MAWLALDPGDADLRLFITHLVAAIQTVEPEVGVEALALLEAGGATPTEAVLVSLINELDVLASPTVYRASVAQARGDVDGTVSPARGALALLERVLDAAQEAGRRRQPG